MLAVAWNALALRYGEQERAMRRNGDVFERAGANVAWTLSSLPAPVLPRIAMFGSSQIAVVKSTSADPVQGTPHQLRIALHERGFAAEVADFSEGGQQTIESLLLYLATREAARPSAVVLGVGLFSMLRVDVRPTLLADLDATRLRDDIAALVPEGTDPRAMDAMLSWSRTAEQRVAGRGQTLQERMDAAIGEWLAARLPAFANRQAMFDALVDQPIRRDLASLASRRMSQQKTARTYEIGSAFPAALLAIETMARAARRDGVPLFVVSMPYAGERPPAPYTDATQARVVGALQASANAAGFQLLDLSHALASDRFGDFADGSPDNLHFDPAGHTAVARRIADALVSALAPVRAGTP